MNRGERRRAILRAVQAAALWAAAGSIQAFQLDTENPDIRMNWDNTFKYNAGWRMQSRDKIFAGENSFAPGSYGLSPYASFFKIGDAQYDKNDTILNRIDWFSEFDFVYQSKYGFRVSAAAWYDDAFRDNIKAPRGFDTRRTTSYPDITKRFQKTSGEFLDAFVFANDTIGDTAYNFKLGQFATLWGDAYFSTANSVGFGQSATDVIKQILVPGASAKETTLPSEAVLLTVQPTPELAFSAHYTGKWRRDRFPQGGTYFGIADPLFEGGVTNYIGPTRDFGHKDNDWGLQAKWTPEWFDGALGLVYREFSAKAPQVLLDTRFQPIAAYANDIKLVGITMNKVLGTWSVSAELSQRRNDPLAAQFYAPPLDIPGLYHGTTDGPRGTTSHLALSGVGLYRNMLGFDSNSVVLELDYVHLDEVTRNRDMFQSKGYTSRINTIVPSSVNCSTDEVKRGCATEDAWTLYFNMEPTWFQLLNGWDFSVPFFYSLNFGGNSPNGNSNDQSSVYNIGARMVYHNRHRFTLAYTGYNARKTTVNGFQQYNTGAPFIDKDWLNFNYEFTY